MQKGHDMLAISNRGCSYRREFAPQGEQTLSFKSSLHYTYTATQSKALALCPWHALYLAIFLCINWQGSVESAQIHRLGLVFPVSICDRPILS